MTLLRNLNYDIKKSYFRISFMSFLKDYNNDEINDIIEDAWEIGWFKSNITFKSIFNKWDLTEEDLNIIMSKYLDSKSYKLWVKKIESRKR